MTYLFTSESVAAGHPDKIADQISDLILDYHLKKDKNARVAAEVFVTPKKIIISGETRSNFHLDLSDLEIKIRKLIKTIGYIDETRLFSWQKVIIEFCLHKQSPDIAQGVDEGKNKLEGAGDQGIMFGYACDETEDFMPAPIYYSHQILRAIYENLAIGNIAGFGADAKSQITFKYQDGKPISVDTILLSIQHQEHITNESIVEQIKPIIQKTIKKDFLTDETKFLFNPTGKFVIGGPESDVGLTGRKIIVDTYGGSSPHGGGAFSGKDPTKVDRSATYMARYLAKNIVASGLAKKCLLQLSYGIGIAEPISFYLTSFDEDKKDLDKQITEYIRKNIDLTPKAIRTHLSLNNPIYQVTSTYGHFGRKFCPIENKFTWEKLNLVTNLKKKFA